jgi:aminotransferase in exopolysaccharide biosynthesis
MFDDFINFVREIYGTNGFVPLHEPRFLGNEKQRVIEAIDSTFVSSVGKFVDDFESAIIDFTGAKYAIATVNGTAALHVALKLAKVESGDEVITQSLTFVATCNAIRYCNAEPVFIDVNRETLGLSPKNLEEFLEEHCEIREDGFCWNRVTNKIIRACIPVHTFGFPAQLEELIRVCNRFNITLIEDAAESLGSYFKGQHTGTFGKLASLSFNGNKIITSGGGGMILTNDKEIAIRAKHVTTTAKIPHQWAFEHDETGFNYRLPNINAALGVAQMESLPVFVEKKRELARKYQEWGEAFGFKFVREPNSTKVNYWLNALITENKTQRDAMLEETNRNDVMTRPAWVPMHMLPMNKNNQSGEMKNTEWLFERIVNVPSSIPIA